MDTHTHTHASINASTHNGIRVRGMQHRRVTYSENEHCKRTWTFCRSSSSVPNSVNRRCSVFLLPRFVCTPAGQAWLISSFRIRARQKPMMTFSSVIALVTGNDAYVPDTGSHACLIPDVKFCFRRQWAFCSGYLCHDKRRRTRQPSGSFCMSGKQFMTTLLPAAHFFSGFVVCSWREKRRRKPMKRKDFAVGLAIL